MKATNDLQARGAKFLADALKVNTSLTALYIGKSDCNLTGGNDLKAEGAQYVADALARNNVLTLLDIGTYLGQFNA